MSDVAGKVALITGGGTGIGKGVALLFAREGMKLALNGLEQAPTADNQYETKHIGGYSAALAVAEEIGATPSPSMRTWPTPLPSTPCSRRRSSASAELMSWSTRPA